jgi:hypothetical protein
MVIHDEYFHERYNLQRYSNCGLANITLCNGGEKKSRKPDGLRDWPTFLKGRLDLATG